MDGRLYFSLKDGSCNSRDVVRFLAHLAQHIDGKLLVLWDGNNIHGGPEVREFLATADGARVQTERFPAYAPELNPDELVWRHLKRVELRNVCCATVAELATKARQAIARLRRRPNFVANFARHAGLI